MTDKVREAFERYCTEKWSGEEAGDFLAVIDSLIEAGDYSELCRQFAFQGWQAAASHYAMDGALLDLFETILENKHERELGWKGYLDELRAYREKVGG